MSASAQEVLELVDAVLRTAGDLTRAGDRIAAEHGQSSARSLVLGALDEQPDSIAEVARRRGLRRQSVQETMRRLELDGLVQRDGGTLRAPRFVLTRAGREVRRRTHEAYLAWAQEVAARLDPRALAGTLETLGQLRSDA